MAEEKSSILDGTFEEVIKAIEALGPGENKAEEYQKIYDGEHAILARPDKVVKTANGESKVTTAKIVLNYQEDIVESSVAFLFGSPLTISKTTDGGDTQFQELEAALEDIYFNSRNKELARKLFIQCRAAKLYYVKNPTDKENRSLASIILSQDNGDFIPVFEKGSMIAFLRKFTETKSVDGKAKKVEMCELYTAEQIIYAEKTDAGWEEEAIKNEFGKIPVVYYEQKIPEWHKVLSIIEKQEDSYSKLIDTNDYFAKPKLTVSGKISNLPEKGTVGEVLEMEIIESGDGSKVKSEAKYLTWDQRPESSKLQFDMAENYIYKFTQTADANFLNMSKASIGNLSGVALQMLMLAPIIKSLNKQEQFNEMLKRELNVVMSILSKMNAGSEKAYKDMKLKLTFNSIMPDNISEVIEDLVTATSGGIMSKETAIEKNPLVDNSVAEKVKVKAESTVLSAIAEPDV